MSPSSNKTATPASTSLTAVARVFKALADDLRPHPRGRGATGDAGLKDAGEWSEFSDSVAPASARTKSIIRDRDLAATPRHIVRRKWL